MFWLFLFIGAATSASVLYRIGTSLASGDRREIAWSLIALLFVGAAWTVGHASAFGWTSLLAAAAIESISHFRRKTTVLPIPLKTNPMPPSLTTPGAARATANPADAAIGTADAAATIAPSPDLSPRAPIELRALLESPWSASPEVLVASLRRAGQRDARAWTRPGERTIKGVSLGGFEIAIESIDRPAPRELLEFCLAQAFDWADAADAISRHRGQVVFTAAFSDQSAPFLLLESLLQAALALGEFSALVGLAWPASGKLISPARAQALPGDRSTTGAAQSCVCFRAFADEPSTGFVADTSGLHAWGLPDFELHIPGEPDIEVTRLLQSLAAVSLAEPRRQSAISIGRILDEVDWRRDRVPSSHPPDRPVLKLTKNAVGSQA